MIIQMIPETEEERLRYQEKGVAKIEHTGVREFLFFGNKIDSENDLTDFHEWHGSYRYLMGSLNYFYESINDNRRNGQTHSNLSAKSSPMIKRGKIHTDITPLDVSMFKKGNADVREEGAFDEEEDQAAQIEEVEGVQNEQYVTVEELEQEAQKARDKVNPEAEGDKANIFPHGLRIVK